MSNLRAARKRLRTVARSIDQARMELLEIKGDLRPSGLERSRLADLGDNPGASTEMRSTIDCVNQDLESVVRALLEAADFTNPRRLSEKRRTPEGLSDTTGASGPAAGGLLPQADWIFFYSEEGDGALRQVLSSARRLARSVPRGDS